MHGSKGLNGRLVQQPASTDNRPLWQRLFSPSGAGAGAGARAGHNWIERCTRLPTEKQILYTGATLLTALLSAAALTTWGTLQTRHRAAYEARAGELQVLSQRVPLAAQQAVLGNAAAFARLAAAQAAFSATLTALADGDADLPPTPAAAHAALQQVRERWQGRVPEISHLLGHKNTLLAAAGNLPPATQANVSADPLVRAGYAARTLFIASDALLADSTGLAARYRTLGNLSYGFAAFAAVIALAALVVLGLINLRETRVRARKSEAENQRTQEAILRLMDDLGELAEGNLAIRASVTEDITGAIADSINYTVEELRNLVRGINQASEQIDSASRSAGEVSESLLAAALRQADEIEETSNSVVGIAQSVQQVSEHAQASARVAQQSLAAAQQGQHAVANAIDGMNSLREQIQETAKRIKRLGESSQEIGEIVELISDLTEQTNVLALNAAIQAAAAGVAGRGFSVVAEEVQRLAERSADATRQIAVIVRTIQSDTHATVAAMETSTQSVIEGANLSDAAGQTLAEIGDVSKKLAGLIADISATTQDQAEATAKVASAMQDIRAISAQTASAIDGLATLAQQLKNSVSGFKLD